MASTKTIPALLASNFSSVPTFLATLGMSESREDHMRLYRNMEAQVLASEARMNRTRDSLLAHLRHDPSIQPPYAITQVSESAVQAQIHAIYAGADAELRCIFRDAVPRSARLNGRTSPNGIGPGDDAVEMWHGESWVIRWLLFHVFMYGGGDYETHSRRDPGADELAAMSNGGSNGQINGGYRAFYDPVRG